MNNRHDFARGIRLYRQGMYRQAKTELTNASATGGVLGRIARYYRGRACYEAAVGLARQGDLAGTQAYLGRSAGLLGRSSDLAVYLARAYGAVGRRRRAEAKLNAAADLSHGDPNIVARLARTQARDGRTVEAMMTLRAALREHPDAAELHLQAGLVLSRQGRLSEAGEHFRRACECDCCSAPAHRYLGLCKAAEGRCAEAVGHLSRAHALRPHDIVCAYELASVARAAADRPYDCPLRLQPIVTPSDSNSLRDLAEFVTAESDFVGAMLSLPPSEIDSELFSLLSAVMDLALEIHERYADLHYRQALILRRLDDHEGAAGHARRALEINGRYVQARILLGKLLVQTDPAAAIEQLTAAVTLGGDYADVHAELGGLYQAAGDTDKARRAWTRALEINHSFTKASDALRRLAA